MPKNNPDYSGFTPDQQWKLYRKAKQFTDWMDAVDWAKEEFHLDKSPGRSAFYCWMATMHKLECENRLKRIGFAVAQSSALGKKMPNDELIVATFKILAFEAGVAGNVKDANAYTQIASTIQKLQYRKLDFEWEDAYRKRKEAERIAARDAARQQALLDRTRFLNKPISETVDYLKDHNACLRVFSRILHESSDQQALKDVLKRH